MNIYLYNVNFPWSCSKYNPLSQFVWCPFADNNLLCFYVDILVIPAIHYQIAFGKIHLEVIPFLLFCSSKSRNRECVLREELKTISSFLVQKPWFVSGHVLGWLILYDQTAKNPILLTPFLGIRFFHFSLAPCVVQWKWKGC